MTKLLTFNPDRRLGFEIRRALYFKPDRKLDFDINRKLSFNMDRDLGFSKRGKVFRGYTCSACGGLTTEMSTECTECGAVFQTKEPGKVAAIDEKEVKQEAKYCRYCGYRMPKADIYCSRCGLKDIPRKIVGRLAPSKVSSGSDDFETIKLSKKKEKKIIVDWKEKGKDFKEYLEQ